MAVKKMPKQKGSFAKGGLRFTKLRTKVETMVPSVRWWFIGTGANQARTASLTASLLVSKEMIFAVSHDTVHILPLTGPGIVSTKIKSGDIRSVPKSDIEVIFDPTRASLSIGDVDTQIFPLHEFEALQFAHACGARLPDWFIPA